MCCGQRTKAWWNTKPRHCQPSKEAATIPWRLLTSATLLQTSTKGKFSHFTVSLLGVSSIACSAVAHGLASCIWSQRGCPPLQSLFCNYIILPLSMSCPIWCDLYAQSHSSATCVLQSVCTRPGTSLKGHDTHLDPLCFDNVLVANSLIEVSRWSCWRILCCIETRLRVEAAAGPKLPNHCPTTDCMTWCMCQRLRSRDESFM